MNEPALGKCPRCDGELERRVEWTNPKPEAVFQCLGACGTAWSTFDLDLARHGGKS